ncbi:MAG TPA: hypothetical protein VMZ73_04275 [Acidimicrobiales bacterium]|nr:hypothetical protein [Acidimicrobiales bacterium]
MSVYGPAGGRCSQWDATAEGEYSFGPPNVPATRFEAICTTNPQTGAVITSGFVDVPAGTRINGGAPVATTTPVTGTNVPVVYPNGRTATLNQVITTPTSVTRNAIVFAGGPTVGQVVCGAAPAYPLAVDTAAGATPAPLAPLTSSGDGGGVSTTMVLAGAFALAVVAQLTIGRRMWRRKGEATG